MSERILCESCSKQKNIIRRIPSKLLPKLLLLCETCIARNLEPRYIVILAHIDGDPKALDFIKNHRYIGDEIKLVEVL